MRAQFSNKLSFILATAGSAIGLGNLWRFPYVAGKYGGGAFLLIYIISVFALGYFMLSSIFAFGRTSQTNIIDAFEKTASKAKRKISPLWRFGGGWMCLINSVLVCAVYSIVIGWTLSYVFESFKLLLGISHQTIDETLFKNLTSTVSRQFFWSALCIAFSSLVIFKGVQKGIEKFSLYLVPFLFFLLFFLAVWIAFLPNTEKGFAFFLKPDWRLMGFTSSGFNFDMFFDLLMTAVGQSIYSLSMGLGIVFAYGSYMKKEVDIKNATKWIVILDFLVSFLAGLIVLPAVFAFGLEPGQGAGLSFVSLPLIFAQIKGGYFLMFMFFVLLFLAAITSLIAMYEAGANIIMEKFSLSRAKTSIFIGLLNIVTAFIILLSFTGTVNLSIGQKNLFDAIDWLTGSITLSFTTVFVCLFVGWKIFPAVFKELEKNSHKSSKFIKKYNRWVVQIIAPATIILICLGALL